jgi:hypothetical protein
MLPPEASARGPCLFMAHSGPGYRPGGRCLGRPLSVNSTGNSIRACLQLGEGINFAALPESKSERIGIKSRTPFAAVTYGILESTDE